MSRLSKLGLVALLLYLVWASVARAAPGAGFTPVWIDESAHLSDVALADVITGLEGQDSNPENIVFLIHGFDDPRERTTQEYSVLAGRVKGAFNKYNHRASVVGVQWDAQGGGFILALPRKYAGKADLARKIGRMGLRQLLLRIQDRFPRADLVLMAYSMGCEVAGSTLGFTDYQSEHPAPIYEPNREINLYAVALCASDLDFDSFYRSGVKFPGNMKLVWMTNSDFWRHYERDKLLDLRALLHGTAGGATFPRMTEAQYDTLMQSRAVVFDSRSIPSDHAYFKYYEQERLNRIASSILRKSDPSVPASPEVAAIDKVMDAPDEERALRPFLDEPLESPQVYALWRLETLFGSGSKNFANLYMFELVERMKNEPRAMARERLNSPSPTVRRGDFPTPSHIARAGDPAWADHLGLIWVKNHSGEVTYIDDKVLKITTDRYNDKLVFDIDPNRTIYTPSWSAVRVGSKVRVDSLLQQARAVEVVPFSRWLRQQH